MVLKQTTKARKVNDTISMRNQVKEEGQGPFSSLNRLLDQQGRSLGGMEGCRSVGTAKSKVAGDLCGRTGWWCDRTGWSGCGSRVVSKAAEGWCGRTDPCAVAQGPLVVDLGWFGLRRRQGRRRNDGLEDALVSALGAPYIGVRVGFGAPCGRVIGPCGRTKVSGPEFSHVRAMQAQYRPVRSYGSLYGRMGPLCGRMGSCAVAQGLLDHASCADSCRFTPISL